MGSLIDNTYPTNDAGGVGWADDIGGVTPSNVAAFETTSDLTLSASTTTLRFNLFAGGFGNHTLGSYRISYTSDDRSTFANGLDNGGAVAANWIPIIPTVAISGGGATLTIQPDGRILASVTNPNLSTDTLYATFAPQSAPITGFRIEAIEDASLPNNGPGRPGNGNFVVREFDPAIFLGNRITLQNGTAQVSQGGFSVDNMLNGDFDFTSAGGEGWANNAAANNIATFETTADIVGTNLMTAEIFSGGFGTHTIGRFRLSVTDADRSLFADGNDNGGAGVGAEPIWTVVNIDSVTSDVAGTTFTELADLSILAGGTNPEFAHYTVSFSNPLLKITGFRLEAFEDASFPANGPGRSSNGNFVIREFSVFALGIPEPTSLALLPLAALALGGRRRKA